MKRITSNPATAAGLGRLAIEVHGRTRECVNIDDRTKASLWMHYLADSSWEGACKFNQLSACY